MERERGSVALGREGAREGRGMGKSEGDRKAFLFFNFFPVSTEYRNRGAGQSGPDKYYLFLN